MYVVVLLVFELANDKNAIVRVHVTTVGSKIYNSKESESGNFILPIVNMEVSGCLVGSGVGLRWTVY